MTKEELQRAISEMDVYVPVRIIERNLGMPKTTLQKFLKGGRDLPKKWQKTLEAYFSKQPELKKEMPAKKEKPKDVPKNDSGSRAFMNDAIRKKLGL